MEHCCKEYTWLDRCFSGLVAWQAENWAAEIPGVGCMASWANGADAIVPLWAQTVQALLADSWVPGWCHVGEFWAESWASLWASMRLNLQLDFWLPALQDIQRCRALPEEIGGP